MSYRFTSALIFIFSLCTVEMFAQCPTLESYNQGNGGSQNCAGVSGTAVNADFSGTTYATVPAGGKTGNFTARWASTPTPTPAVAGFYENALKLTQVAGPSTVLTTIGGGYAGSYCFYGSGNLPTNTTISVMYVNPSTGALMYTCNYTIPNGNNVTASSVAGPSITSQPVSKVGCIGYASSFSVTASPGNAGTLSYQWQKNGTDISGATSSTYTISSVSVSDTGTSIYRVVVKETKVSTVTLVSSNEVSLTLNREATWVGTTNNWATSSNWVPASLPDSTTHVYVPSGASNMPAITSGTAKCKCLTLDGSSVMVNGGTLEIAGRINLVNSGNITATNGTIVLNGTELAQAIPAATFSSNTVSNLTVANTNGVTLAGTVNLTGTYTPTSGILTTGGYLTLKSNNTATARVATGSASSGYISGNVTVERYIPAHTNRAWRLLAPATSGTQTIKQAWQENASSINDNPNPGYGTIITCNGNYSTSAGFDQVMPSSSIQVWSVDSQSLTKVPVTNTNIKTLSSEQGYFLYIRGDRTVMPSNSIASPTATILRSTGTVATGDRSAVSVPAGKKVLVGNPYPSAIDFSTISGSDKTNVGNKFWLWDPMMTGSYGLGAYVLFDAAASWAPSAPGGSYHSANSTIPLGMAFFVESAGSAGSLTLREAHKVSGSTSNGFKTTANSEQLHIQLSYIKDSATIIPADGAFVVFNSAYADTVDVDDAQKLANLGENIAIGSGANDLALNARSNITDDDTVALKLWKLKKVNYRLTIKPSFQTLGLEARLVDKYLQKDTALDLTVPTVVDFKVNNDTLSYAPDRFYIAFRIDHVVSVNEPSFINNVTVYPNPTDGKSINIKVKNAPAGNYSVKLMDNSGRIVFVDEFAHNAGVLTKSWQPRSHLPSGTYYIAITNDGLPVWTQKLIIHQSN
ncbi:T9SS type A sorting domain-containing protein [Polluticoccus soli]|uniref:T9SS type A sorting domain-containing protein n=1 Tax=Polluticoccus soli TaxID=3034150 RepID=UPI0023E147F9|nr:T9SS type A sorting domain-containing protein [Flavipsychrobacter sp. JY13-12]